MPTIEKSIEVNVPEYTAYAQWTRFEEFPQFLEGEKEIKQLDAKRFHWKLTINGQHQEWDTELTEQAADQHLAWKSNGGAIKRWKVTFHRLSTAKTKITLQLDYDSQGLVEPTGDASGAMSSRVQGDLERFKTYIEQHWDPGNRESIFEHFPF